MQEFKYAKERVGKLFTILTQTKEDEFRRVVKQLNPEHLETFDFYLQIQRKRNAIVHEGNIWDIPRTMPGECLHRVSSLLWMFVDVHNYYIPKLYQRRRPEHDEIEYMI